MAEVNPPSWEQAGTYAAYQDRMTACSLITPHYSVGQWAPRPGVRPSYQGLGMQVTQDATPDMFVLVNTGTVFVPATIVTNAGWVCHNNGSKSLTVQAASPSQPRIDLVIAHVYDAVDDSGTLNQWALEVVKGTPASSPVAPAAPTNSITLAQVLVPANASSITTADITDTRTYTVALGGVLPALSTGKPAQPYQGQVIYNTDTGQVQVYNGTSWQAVNTGLGPWSSFQAAAGAWNASGAFHTFTSAQWAPVTFTVPPSGSIFITIDCCFGNTSAGDNAWVGWQITGTDSIPWATRRGLQASVQARLCQRRLVTGLTPGGIDTVTPGWDYNLGGGTDTGDGALIVEAVP